VDVRTPGESRRPLLFLVLFAATGLAILAGLLLWLGLKGDDDGGSSKTLAKTMRDAGCTFRSFKAPERNEHVQDGTKIKYKSFPPTFGKHYGTPAVFNAYDVPLEQERLVHNLEHGGVVIQYGKDVPEATVAEVSEFYQSDPNGLIVAPLSRLNDKIALTAWEHLATCTRFDEDAFAAFRDEYRAKGPEPRRIEDLAPGQTS
jgi:hypothetical protein